MSDLSPRQAADQLGISLSLVYRLIESGELQAHRMSNRIRISPESIDQLRERNRVKPRSAPAYEPVLRSRPQPRSNTFVSQLRDRERGRAA